MSTVRQRKSPNTFLHSTTQYYICSMAACTPLYKTSTHRILSSSKHWYTLHWLLHKTLEHIDSHHSSRRSHSTNASLLIDTSSRHRDLSRRSRSGTRTSRRSSSTASLGVWYNRQRLLSARSSGENRTGDDIRGRYGRGTWAAGNCCRCRVSGVDSW